MLMLSENIEDQISDISNITELNDVIKDIYTPRGWFLFDIVIVLAHMSLVFMLGSPILALAIFVRMQ